MKLLIVDDHAVMREGLAALLMQEGADPEGRDTVILQACDAPSGLTIVIDHGDLDAVILDFALPGLTGLAALSAFGRARPELPVIVLSSSEDPRDARAALAQGALGYVPKSATPQTLLSALRLVLNGDLYIPPLILREAALRPGEGAGPRTGATAAALTKRQIDVLRHIALGQPNKAIALDLAMSEKTVKIHVTAIFKALNVVNRTQAAAAGREAGLI